MYMMDYSNWWKRQGNFIHTFSKLLVIFQKAGLPSGLNLDWTQFPLGEISLSHGKGHKTWNLGWFGSHFNFLSPNLLANHFQTYFPPLFMDSSVTKNIAVNGPANFLIKSFGKF